MPNSWEALIAHWDRRIQQAFLQSIYNVRGRAQLDAIARLLEAGDVDGALRAVGLDPASFRPLDKAINEAYETGGLVTARSVPPSVAAGGLRTVFQFNVRNPAAEMWLRDYSATLVKEIVADQQKAIRSHLTNGMAKGLNPRTVALDLVGRIGASGRREGGVIGLTSTQEQWVSNFADELENSPSKALSRALRDKRFDPSIRKAIEDGEPIDADLRAKMVATYRNRALRYRAEAIGRTEAMASLHAAQEEAMNQATQRGVVSADTVFFVWRTANDSRVRDSHAAMDGQKVRKGEFFTSGLGNKLRYPGDPMGPPEDTINCRCFRETAIDFLAGIE